MTPYQQDMLLTGNDDEPIQFNTVDEFFKWQASRTTKE